MTLYTAREGEDARMIEAPSKAAAWAHVRQGISLKATTPSEAAKLTAAGVVIEEAGKAGEPAGGSDA